MRSPAPLQLDFVRAPGSRWRWLGWCLLALAVAGALALAERHAQFDQDLATAQARHDRLERALRARQGGRPAAAPEAGMLADVRRANQVIEQLTLPWDALFAAIESAGARGLGLLSIMPTARDRTVRLSGEARDLDAVLGYVGRLAAQPGLSQVHLQAHATLEREGTQVVSFTIAASWRGLP